MLLLARLLALGMAAAEPAHELAHVNVLVAGPSDTPVAACARIDELVAEHDVTLACAATPSIDARGVVAWHAPGDDGLARVWIDLHGDAHATVYLLDVRSERILVRRVPLADGKDDVFLEQLGQIVATAIEALQDGAVIGLARDEAVAAWGLPAPATNAVPRFARASAPTPRVRALQLELALGYQLAGWSRQSSGLHGPVLAIAAALRRTRLRPGAMFAAQLVVPTGFSHPLVDATIDGWTLRGWARLDPRLGNGPLALRTALGVGVDVLRTRPRGGAIAGAVPHVRLWDARAVLSASLGIDITASAALHVQLDALVELDLRDTRFALGDPPLVVFDPWRVRPGARVAFAFDVLGGRRRASKKRVESTTARARKSAGLEPDVASPRRTASTTARARKSAGLEPDVASPRRTASTTARARKSAGLEPDVASPRRTASTTARARKSAGLEPDVASPRRTASTTARARKSAGRRDQK